MCLSPIDVLNPSRYVSTKFRDRYVMQVPCGRCSQCMTNKSNEWSYRLYYHALDTFRDGFVLFDTLTYNNDSLPHISDYIGVPKDLDFPCFSHRDLRLFVANLRQRCKRQFKSNFTYFIASEYGTSSVLHRPHYHALFFVKGSISPIQFSSLIASTWNKGRTDGVPFRSAYHVHENTFRCMSDGALRSLKYVCKYIQKSCKFQAELDWRLRSIMDNVSNTFASHGLLGWSSSSHFWRVRDALRRRINQFHVQSTFLGADVLGSLDIDNIFKTGSLYMPDNEVVIKQIPLPTYFKRKLFYELVEIDGSKSWQPTELGEKYLAFRNKFSVQSLSDRLHALSLHCKIKIDADKLSDYVLNFRGRFNSSLGPSSIVERLNNLTHYNYISRYDREQFGSIGVTSPHKFLGNSYIGYARDVSSQTFGSLRRFISSYVYFDDVYENQLKILFAHSSELGLKRQAAFARKQELNNLVHHFFS